MTPEAIIEGVKKDGVRLALSPAGTIKACGDEAAVSRWLPIIREQKPGIVAALRSAERVVVEPAHPVQPGDTISWTRADGSTQTGVVDDLHTDPTGVVWAFIHLPGGSWTAVNLKFATPGAA